MQEKLLLGVTGVPSQASEASPDSASDIVPLAVVEEVVKMVPSLGELTVRDGGVLSMLRVTLILALLFALSVTVPLTTWFAPSEETIWVLGHDVIVAPPGTHLNVTVTFVLFHPAALGAGDMEAVIVGNPAAVMVALDEKVKPFVEAVTVVAPALTPVTSPLDPMVAMPAFDEPQVTVEVISRLVPSE